MPRETFSIGDVDPEDLLEESTVRTYSDSSTGVQLRAEYQPPEHDLFMGSDVEMQVLHRSGDAPWEKVSMGKGKLPYERGGDPGEPQSAGRDPRAQGRADRVPRAARRDARGR